jgi:hypothetical protein
MQVYGKMAAKKTAYTPWRNNPFGAPFGGASQPAMPATKQETSPLMTEKDVEGVSMFKLAIRGG